MRSSNPVLSRRGAFGQPQQGQSQGAAYGGGQQQAYGGPYAGQAGQQAGQQYPPLTPDQMQQMYSAPSATAAQAGRMTYDDVIARTAMLTLVMVVAAAFAWAFIPFQNFGWVGGAAVVGTILAYVQIFRRTVSPAIILGYAVFEGIFLGAFSHVMETYYSGIVIQAVLGTAAVFIGMLVAYRSGWIKVTGRYARIGLSIAIGFFLLMMVNFVVAMIAGSDALGLTHGPLGVLTGAAGVLIGAFFLSLDFKEIDGLVAAGVPERESWRAAFGLVLGLVYIYVYMLQMLRALQD